MISRRVAFTGSEGQELSGVLDLPLDGEPVACALFAHCFTCSKDLRPVVNISRSLTQQRIGVLRFDFTGLGESGGEFEETGFSTNVADLAAAARYMGERLRAPSLLVGHSLGGAAVIQAASRIPSARAVSTINAPADPAHVLRLLKDSIEEIERRGEATVELAGRRFTIRREFLEELEAVRMKEAIASLGRPLLIFHAPLDRTVGIENAARIFQAARHPKSFVSLDDADHLLLDEKDSRYVGSVLGAWAQRYVERPAAPTIEALRTEEGVVARTPAGSFRTEILAQGHALVSDEPEALGGGDEGPDPYELLSAALGACTTMTLQMYAARKEWPLEEATVRLRHTRLYGLDEAHCEEEAARMDRIERVVELTGPLDEAQRRRLLEIADRCPVHRTLDAGVEIRTRLAGGASDGGPG